MATKVDSVLSENSAKMSMYTYIGLAGIVLNILTLFVSPITSNLNVNPIYMIFALGSCACSGIAMYYIYDSLKKGMVNLETPLTSLLQWCAYTVLAYQGLAIIGNLIAWGAGGLVGGGVIMTIAGLIGLVYFVLYIIVGCKLMSNYEGKLKTLGIVMIAIPAIMIVSWIIGAGAALAGGSGITLVIGLLGAACSAYQYILAHEVITGKGLF